MARTQVTDYLTSANRKMIGSKVRERDLHAHLEPSQDSVLLLDHPGRAYCNDRGYYHLNLSMFLDNSLV